MFGFHFDGANFMAGVLVALVATGFVHWFASIFAILLLVSFEFKGAPYLRILYQSGQGWSVDKGRHK